MNKPVQHHYLPQGAYLRFFESPEKKGFVWMYERGRKPILVNIKNAAKERHLYSFLEEDGKYNTELESAFAEMEQIAIPVIKKLNNANRAMFLTTQEKSDLSWFLAMQFVRTPAFRNELKKIRIEFTKIYMRSLASNKKAFAQKLEAARKWKPSTPKVSVEDMQEFVFSDRYDVKITGGNNYFLKQVVKLGDRIWAAIMMKNVFILRTTSNYFITSDYPVNLISDPSADPFLSGGFLMAGVLVPIGSETALFFKNTQDFKDPNKKKKVFVDYYEITPERAEWINSVNISRAERFLFGASNDTKIKELFDKTTVPKRFYMDSPFFRKK